MTWTKTTTTPHSHAVVFGRKVDGCPRCQELAAGAPVVKGWSTPAPRVHVPHVCGPTCSPICCTHGDW